MKLSLVTKHKSVLCLLSLSMLLTSCTHPLTVKNIGLYKASNLSSSTGDLKLGIQAVTNTPEEERLVMATVNTLKRDGFKVTYPFYPNEGNKSQADYYVKLSTSSQFDGSGMNFLINWPGFLIFTPAWHGYNYRAQFNFDIDVTDHQTDETLPRMSVPVDLDIRHADMNRTWTEISWLEWSIIAFVGGILFTRYDKSVTPMLVDATENKIADYVGSKLAATLMARQKPVLAAEASE